MRNRVIVPIVVLIAVVGAAALLARRGSGPQEAPQGAGPLPPRIVTAGSVEVSIEPIRLDDGGAVFRVALNTHSGDLEVDLARAARLEVDGKVWGDVTWKGDPPGGHHRQGELSFRPSGPAAGGAVLTIDGLPGPVEATWNLG